MPSLRPSPALQWERFGQRDPYFGVLSDEIYRRESLTEQSIAQFFETGSTHIDRVMRLVSEHTGDEPRLQHAMDFGCGVGRLLIPLAARAQSVVGVDVSASMLAQARSNCEASGVDNVSLVETPQLATLEPSFDLVHSYIVLQHIPPAQGYALFERLAALLAPAGVGAIHVAVSPSGRLSPSARLLKYVPYAANLSSLRRGRGWSYPTMQMNCYRVERLLSLLHEHGIERMSVAYEPAGRAGDFNSAMLIFQKPP